MLSTAEIFPRQCHVFDALHVTASSSPWADAGKTQWDGGHLEHGPAGERNALDINEEEHATSEVRRPGRLICMRVRPAGLSETAYRTLAWQTDAERPVWIWCRLTAVLDSSTVSRAVLSANSASRRENKQFPLREDKLGPLKTSKELLFVSSSLGIHPFFCPVAASRWALVAFPGAPQLPPAHESVHSSDSRHGSRLASVSKDPGPGSLVHTPESHPSGRSTPTKSSLSDFLTNQAGTIETTAEIEGGDGCRVDRLI